MPILPGIAYRPCSICYLVVSVDVPHANFTPPTFSQNQGKPTYDVLLQPPVPSTAAGAPVSTTSNSAHREEDEQEAAADDEAAGRELTALSASDISLLQPFELDDLEEDKRQGEEVSQVAERLKDRGNTLFKLGDTDAAAEMFVRVLKTLEPKPVVGDAMYFLFFFRGLCERKHVLLPYLAC